MHPKRVLLSSALFAIGVISWSGNRAEGVQEQALASYAVVESLAVLHGTVVSEANAPLSNADVAIPALSRNGLSDSLGRFRIVDIAAGTYDVRVRRLGYAVLTTTVEFKPGQVVERTLKLTRLVTLDTLSVVATPYDRMLREFEDNRRLGLGKFWTRADLEKLEGFQMSSILSQVTGTRVVRGKGTSAWVARSRGVYTLGGTDASRRIPSWFDRGLGAPPYQCYCDVYVNGVAVYSGRREEPLFNINSLAPADIEGVEFYARSAQTPARYSRLDSPCGVLVIWLRR